VTITPCKINQLPLPVIILSSGLFFDDSFSYSLLVLYLQNATIIIIIIIHVLYVSGAQIL